MDPIEYIKKPEVICRLFSAVSIKYLDLHVELSIFVSSK